MQIISTDSAPHRYEGRSEYAVKVVIYLDGELIHIRIANQIEYGGWIHHFATNRSRHSPSHDAFSYQQFGQECAAGASRSHTDANKKAVQIVSIV